MPASRRVWVAQKGGLNLWTLPKRDLKPGEVYVDVKAVGIEPADVKHVAQRYADGCGQGCDFAGVIAEVGPEVNARVGDCVAGGAIGGNVDAKEDGAFADLVKVPAWALVQLPSSLTTSSDDRIPAGPVKTFEQAASLCFDLASQAATLESTSESVPNIYASNLASDDITDNELMYYWLQQPVKKLGTRANPRPESGATGKAAMIFRRIGERVSQGTQAPPVRVLKGFEQIPDALNLLRSAQSSYGEKIVVSFV